METEGEQHQSDFVCFSCKLLRDETVLLSNVFIPVSVSDAVNSALTEAALTNTTRT